MDTISIFWFRRDLRLEDNLGLIQSLQNSTEVIPCFIYDENLIKNDNVEESPNLNCREFSSFRISLNNLKLPH